MDSKEMIGRVVERYEELKHYGFDWRSFYNGWLEGRADMLRADPRLSEPKVVKSAQVSVRTGDK